MNFIELTLSLNDKSIFINAIEISSFNASWNEKSSIVKLKDGNFFEVKESLAEIKTMIEDLEE